MTQFTFTLLLSFLVASVNAAERVSGTEVFIEPPTYLDPARNFSGYLDKEYGTSLMITEVPGPFEDVSKGMTAEGFAKKGMKLISRENNKWGQSHF